MNNRAHIMLSDAYGLRKVTWNAMSKVVLWGIKNPWYTKYVKPRIEMDGGIVAVKILFWNLKKNSVEKYIADCIDEQNIDIALFAEYDGINFDKLIENTGFEYEYIQGMGGCEKIALVVKKACSVEIKREQDRYVLYKIALNGKEYIIAGVHLQDRMSCDANRRIIKIGRLINDIKNLETSSQCKRTIIIGDFNANPYDDELLAINAFNAVLFKDEIMRSETRTVDGETYRRFYNPVLHYISETTKMYGSFYYNQDSSTSIWHCLDQVLVSKNLANNICKMEYLRTIKGKSLFKRVRPNNEISDHLPLVADFLEE